MKSWKLGVTIGAVVLVYAGVASAQYAPPPYAPPPAGGYQGGGYQQPNPPPPTYAPGPVYTPQPVYAPGGGVEPYYDEHKVRPERRGLMLGGALGVGAITFDDGIAGGDDRSEGGGAGQFYIGAYLNQNLAIMFDAEVVTFQVGDYESDAWFSQVIGSVAVKAHLGDRFWVKGGLGYAQLQYEDRSTRAESEPGAALMLGAGFEVWQRRHSSIDIQLNASYGSYGEQNSGADRQTISNGALLVGFNWY